LPARCLRLEITESVAMRDAEGAIGVFEALRALGVQLVIDDFGTGCSSLAQLYALPIGTHKTDRSLLVAAERAAGGESGAVLTAIVALTRTLGIRSVAEGVETAEHLRMVRAAGCDLAQGWLLGQPMPAEQVPSYCRRVQAAGGDMRVLVEQGRAAG
jgi:EAL domain-containing protein (putative c-di-GMP-specific phosphodiesterase class I)